MMYPIIMPGEPCTGLDWVKDHLDALYNTYIKVTMKKNEAAPGTRKTYAAAVLQVIRQQIPNNKVEIRRWKIVGRKPA